MAGFKKKKDCPCDSPISILIDGKEKRYFPCCKCEMCIARMQLYLDGFLNGDDEE